MASLPVIVAASPVNASDDTREIFSNGTTEIRSFALGDMPSDFATMLSDGTFRITVEVRVVGRVDDTVALGVRIVDSTGTVGLATAGAGEFASAGGITETTDTDKIIAPSIINTTADKATWDGAILQIRQLYTNNMGGDGAHLEVDFARITAGNYIPDEPVKARVSWAEFETTDAPPRGRISWASFMAAGNGVRISHVEMAVGEKDFGPFPYRRQLVASSSPSASATEVISIPTGMVNGNLAVVYVFHCGSGGSTALNIVTPPEGWLVLESSTAPGAGVCHMLMKLVDGTEGSTITVVTDTASNRFSAVAMEWAGQIDRVALGEFGTNNIVALDAQQQLSETLELPGAAVIDATNPTWQFPANCAMVTWFTSRNGDATTVFAPADYRDQTDVVALTGSSSLLLSVAFSEEFIPTTVGAETYTPDVFWAKGSNHPPLLDEAVGWFAILGPQPGVGHGTDALLAKGWIAHTTDALLTATAALVVDAASESDTAFDVVFGPEPVLGVEAATVSDTAFDVLLEAVVTVFEAETTSESDTAFDIVFAIEAAPLVITLTIDLDVRLTVQGTTPPPGPVVPARGLGVVRQGNFRPQIYRPTRRITRG